MKLLIDELMCYCSFFFLIVDNQILASDELILKEIIKYDNKEKMCKDKN